MVSSLNCTFETSAHLSIFTPHSSLSLCATRWHCLKCPLFWLFWSEATGNPFKLFHQERSVSELFALLQIPKSQTWRSDCLDHFQQMRPAEKHSNSAVKEVCLEFKDVRTSERWSYIHSLTKTLFNYVNWLLSALISASILQSFLYKKCLNN